MKILLIYKTDAQLSFASRDVIGVSDQHATAVYICKQQAKKEGNKLSADDIYNLNDFNQTQGYAGDGEFQIEAVELNTLI